MQETIEKSSHGKLFKLISLLYKIVARQIENEIQANDYNDFHFANIFLLMLIERFPNHSLNSLAKLANRSRANISIVAKKMEIKGYLVRVRQENNKKNILLATTAKWKTLKPIIFNLLDEFNNEIKLSLSSERYENLIEDLTKIYKLLKNKQV